MRNKQLINCFQLAGDIPGKLKAIYNSMKLAVWLAKFRTKSEQIGYF